MIDLTVMEIILVHFDENLKILGDFGPAGHFLGVYLVESIDKRLVLCLGNSIDR